MNRVDKTFASGKRPLLSMFLTAGFPAMPDTVSIVRSLVDAGADIIELGMPFSDPVADGPVIQKSSEAALSRGTGVAEVLQCAEAVREAIGETPLFLMGYLNPMLAYGFERCVREAKAAGVDGFILPDLPAEEFERSHKALFEELRLCNVLLVSPNTLEERIRYIDSLSTGFLYAVSSLSITGRANDGGAERERYLSRLSAMNLKNPLLVGFGMKSRADLELAGKYCAGAIVGSALIQHVMNFGPSPQSIAQFMETLR